MADKCKPKIDCFAYVSAPCTSSDSGGCRALSGLYCAKEGKCRFYKTVEQHEADQRRARRRLAILRGEKEDV